MSRSTSASSAFEEGLRRDGSAQVLRASAERRGGPRAKALAFACLGAIALAAGGAGGAQAGTLPDNRGWEIVTPPDQNMDAIARFWSSADGNTTAFQSLGAYSGALNGSGNGYLTTRGAGGWTTQPHTPPGGSGRLFYLDDIADDGGRTIWEASTLSAGAPKTDIWLREPGQAAANVSQAVQGVDTDAEYMSRSADAGHLLFGISPPVIAGSVPDPIQLYDHSGGVTRAVGVLPGQTTPAPGGSVLGSFDDKYGQGSVRNAVSADGSKIFFESPAPPRDAYVHYPYWPTGLYVRENGTTSTLIDPWATFWGAAVDGSTVVYTTSDRGTGDRGLSIFDVATKTAKEIVPTSAQVQGVGGISDDASRIYFVALARLADGATAGEPNVYLYDGSSRLRFVATVNASVNSDPGEAAGWGGKGVSIGATSDLSADGRIFVFASRRQLTSYDNSDRFALYVFDADRPTAPLVCISCRLDGMAPLDHAMLRDNSASNAQGPPSPTTNVTDDGRRIFFDSADPLDSRDVNAQRDVYVWQDGRAHLISSGTGDFSNFLVATPSGDDVFFITSNVLVPQNVTGGLRVIYDARVNGGFAPPVRLTPCEQDGTCQGPPTAPPTYAEPGSVGFTGPGNVVEQASPGAKKPPAFRVGAISRKARVRLARTGRLTIAVRVGAAGTVSAEMRAKIGKRTQTVARASRTAGKAGSVRLTLRLSKAARSELRQGRRLRVRTVVRYSKVSGAKQASFTLAGAKQKGGR